MNVEDWVKIFETYKDYGLNHVRYHSWCPPEAAFKAANRVVDVFGNHPSFTIFCIGNEFGNSDFDVMKNWIAEVLKKLRHPRLNWGFHY